jgi:hypothetical protein
MAYDDKPADRIRDSLAGRRVIREVKMMGGLCFMIAGHMAIGIVGDELMVRVGPDPYQRALARAHVRDMDFTGRPTRGFVFVDPAGIRTKRSLESWIAAGAAFASSLPPKPAKPGRGVRISVRRAPERLGRAT